MVFIRVSFFNKSHYSFQYFMSRTRMILTEETHTNHKLLLKEGWNMGDIVYIRMRNKIQAEKEDEIYLSDVALISTEEALKQSLEETKLYQIKKSDKNIVILDVFRVIYLLNKKFKNVEFQPIGPNQTIIMIQNVKKKPSMIFVVCIWLLLFIGAAMAIMNFHYDVSMEKVQQRLHFLLTGVEERHPLWLQVPYSLGLGIGMILFFNHLFKKRINEEPSPLEVEMFKYQQDLDSYVVLHENQLNQDEDEQDDSSSSPN